MEMAEQNISGVKLEKLRQDAVKKYRIWRRLLPVCLLLFAAVSVAKNRYLFQYIGEYGWGSPEAQGAFFHLIGDFMLSIVFAGGIFIAYTILVWQKAYNRFDFSFKNKYVLDIVRQLPGFSQLRYNAQGGFSYEEIDRMNLIPKGGEVFYQSSDEWSGLLEGIPFRAAHVRTGRKTRGRHTLPTILFEGQILAFSAFDRRKSSQGFVQVFSKKVLPQIKGNAVPLKIQTENSVFHENFVVFAENEQNAFYILTPQMQEQITAFQEAMEGKIYLSFFRETMYVTCSQFRNPFDAYIDVPIEEQCRRIEKGTHILQSARKLLVRD